MNRYAVYTYQWQLTPYTSLSEAKWALGKWRWRGYQELRIVGLYPKTICTHCDKR